MITECIIAFEVAKPMQLSHCVGKDPDHCENVYATVVKLPLDLSFIRTCLLLKLKFMYSRRNVMVVR